MEKPDHGDRSPGIDVIRGLAVIFVVLHHVHLRFQINRYDVANLVPRSVERVVFWSGYYSVITFFVISGFLITGLSLKRWGSLEQIDVAHFYRLRAARILPCLLLLLAVLSMLHVLGFSDYAIKPERASLGRVLLAALTFHFNYLEGHRGYFPANWDVLWSLSVEEMFYLGFPFLCWAVRRERLFMVAMILLIIVGPLNRVALAGHRPWDDYAYLSSMDGMAFGCLAAWLSARCRLSRRTCRAMMMLGITCIILIVVLRAQTFALGLTKTALNVSILECGVALTLVAIGSGVGNRLLAWHTAALRSVGRRSYEIYLTHMFVVLGLMHVFKSAVGQKPSFVAFAFTYAAMLALSIGLGHLVARYYSERMNRRLRGSYAMPYHPSYRPVEHKVS
jgi:peptidoglycan/LPS O-acetylase OafA/YrhL